MGDDRSQEELAGGFLRVVVDGSPRNLPTLKIRAEREWKLLLAQTLGETQLNIDFAALQKGGDSTYMALAPMANLATDLAIDLLLAYDRSGVLGGRDFIEEHMDASEVYRALVKCLRVAFPFVADVRSVINELINLRGLVAVARSSNSSSMNGQAPDGVLTPLG